MDCGFFLDMVFYGGFKAFCCASFLCRWQFYISVMGLLESMVNLCVCVRPGACFGLVYS